MSPKVTTDESASSGKGRFTGAQTAVRQQAARAVRILFTTLAVILALGAILHECLSGRPAFAAETPAVSG